MIVVLADQNVPQPAAAWLVRRKPDWLVLHAFDLGLRLAPDDVIAEAALKLGAIVLTFDEDFLDKRQALRESLIGVIRLRIWPNLLPNVISTLERLVTEVPEDQMAGFAVIVDHGRIRVRPL